MGTYRERINELVQNGIPLDVIGYEQRKLRIEKMEIGILSMILHGLPGTVAREKHTNSTACSGKRHRRT